MNGSKSIESVYEEEFLLLLIFIAYGQVHKNFYSSTYTIDGVFLAAIVTAQLQSINTNSRKSSLALFAPSLAHTLW